MNKIEMSNGTKLLLVDDLDPEDLAMVQALYSRSSESAEVHLAKVKETGSGKFMSRFYTGYNHKSIADCGDTTFFIEGVSMLAAKAIQDWPLYSGQETSTRYIDMRKQRIVDPVNSELSGSILAAWMSFYVRNQERVAIQVQKTYPKGPDEEQSHYDGAVKARTFDILRGFLPAGITTQLSWHTNLRQAGEHISGLLHHPSAEIRGFSGNLAELFQSRYQATGTIKNAGVSGVVSDVSERWAWEEQVAKEYTYSAHLHFPPRAMDKVLIHSTLNLGLLHKYKDILGSRPRGCLLPHFLTDAGQLTYSFLLDFGSFRDIQRHRNGVCRMPLLTTQYGFHPWYLAQLDEDLRGDAIGLIAKLEHDIARVSEDPVIRQYYTAFGFRVPTQVTYGLPASIYVMEIRSGKTIHPTLRLSIQEAIKTFESRFPDVKLHVDRSVDDWTVRRGTQTITEKTL
jgi:thymidylate synthase ThyX